MKIKAELIASFLLIAFLAGIVGVVGLRSLTQVSAEAGLLNANATAAILSAKLARNIDRQCAVYLGMTASHELGDDNADDDYRESLDSLISDFDRQMTELGDRLIAEEDHRMLDNISVAYAEFSGLRDDLMSVASEAGSADIREASTIIASAAMLTDKIGMLTDFIEELIMLRSWGMGNQIRNATIMSVAILALTVIVALALGLRLAISITKINNSPPIESGRDRR
jgi:methyl-accepting chemotaxis protein